MQTLGLSDSTPRTENRLKSLFWPSITTGSDVDYVARQGFWACIFVGVLSFLFLAFFGRGVFGVLFLLFYCLGGVGVREGSRYAAIVVCAAYLPETLVLGVGLLSPGGIIRIIVSALLLSNLRATWIASRWKPGSEEAAVPARLNDTWSDKLADQMPMWLWPRIQILYYILSAAVLVLVSTGILRIIFSV